VERSGRRDGEVDSAAAYRQGVGHVLLGPGLTAVRKSSSAVGRTRLLGEGTERGLERVDVQPASDS
jgi:hypothetical protein